MLATRNVEPVDYLVIGHLTQDVVSDGFRLGGTAAYSALTAKALGYRVGIVTAWNPDIPIPELNDIQLAILPCDQITTFRNVQTDHGRVQTIDHPGPVLNYSHVPEAWRHTPIVHLGPVAQEVDPGLVRSFSDSFLGLTPQGWLRDWDSIHRIHPCEWPEGRFMLERASAAVISLEDLGGDEPRIEELASYSHTLVVTESRAGCRIYWNGDLRRIPAPPAKEIDPVGAGDIFAACFFTRLSTTRDPWEAARFATQLASNSVTRHNLQGVPTPEEVKNCLIEVV